MSDLDLAGLALAREGVIRRQVGRRLSAADDPLVANAARLWLCEGVAWEAVCDAGVLGPEGKMSDAMGAWYRVQGEARNAYAKLGVPFRSGRLPAGPGLAGEPSDEVAVTDDFELSLGL